MLITKNQKYLISMLWLCLFSTAHADTSEALYDFIFNNAKIGTVEIQREGTVQDDEPVMIYDASMSLSAKIKSNDYSLETNEHVVVGKQGILHYIAEYEENGKKSRVDGQLDGHKFSGTVQDGDEHHTFLFPVLGFDPIAFVITQQLQNDNSSLSVDFMVPETMEFQKEKRSLVSEERISIAGNSYDCQIIAFNTPYSHGKRWIAKDLLGQFLVKEEGQDKDGKYSIVLKEHYTDSK